jgi:hypothetical protein
MIWSEYELAEAIAEDQNYYGDQQYVPSWYYDHEDPQLMQDEVERLEDIDLEYLSHT